MTQRTRSSEAGTGLLTTVLDLLGSLLVIVAVALAVAAYSVPGALGAAGLLTVLLSWFVDRRGSP